MATVSVCYDGTKKVDGAVVNISEKGLCFFADQPLDPGIVVKVDGSFRLEDFSRDCTIIWCTEIATDLYRIGISFEENP